MPVTVLVGCQWGDEGKGKVADLLSRRMDWVARYGGGHNAGHTVNLGKESFILHLIPCGILQPRPQCVIGHGTVIDPTYLVEEMDALTARGITLEGRLHIAEAAHVLMPYHRWIEALEGQDTRIGTTRRGIGPAYQDKVGRDGIRVLDLLDPARLRPALDQHAARLERRFSAAGRKPPEPLGPAVESWASACAGIADRLRPFVTDTVDLLQNAWRRGERILCEGAQGTFLDVDLGTYPYVTSSTTTAGGAATGLGLPPSALKTVVGICKAYTTRVGEGPFPTEMTGEDGEELRKQGAEYGATTGRPRRVGWLDLVQVRQAVRLNGVTSIFLTKIDILSGTPTLRLCTRYRTQDGALSVPPADAGRLSLCQPEYVEMPGWTEPLREVRKLSDLPAEARAYIARIEEETDCRVGGVSVGSARNAVARV